MPKLSDIRKVMVIGSGPIIIGQAAEFDYAGTQACRALREEGIEVVLVNSNPATIMTDTDVADKVYLEPLDAATIERIIAIERPDSLLPTLGGQVGLNMGVELSESGVLGKYGVRMLGTKLESIRAAEDRQLFKEMLERIGEPAVASVIATDVDTAMAFAHREGYPVIVRPAYTMGGTGGGMADTPEELRALAQDGLRASRVGQVLIEKSIAGWKEIEFEVIRDGVGNGITICSMENFDPVGVHTGDSIVVAPTQTINADEYRMLKNSALKIIEALEIEGGCNIQFALHPTSKRYALIEVNPRVSRSSSLASKATGYPIAKVVTRIAIGYTLSEIANTLTGTTSAFFEPIVDYVVVKVPRWPFDKFVAGDKRIGTRMKATGEVMAIGVSFEAAFNKALRSLEQGVDCLAGLDDLDTAEVRRRLSEQSTERVFVVAEALRRGVPIQDIYRITMIDPWFLSRLKTIVDAEERMRNRPIEQWTRGDLREAKRLDIADSALARFQGVSQARVRALRKQHGIETSFRLVDTCAGAMAARPSYYYSCYGRQSEASPAHNNTIVVLGSGPVRIGQGVEFDYCSVHCVWALRKAGYHTVIINNNPETVSTDYDTSDRLYFEPLTAEDVLGILDIEKPIAVVCQFGGQTGVKLARAVHEAGYRIMGTELKDIDAAEDREQFDALLERLNILRPAGLSVTREDEAVEAANRLGYPVLVRPSYVLGGQGMVIAHSDDDVRDFMNIIGRMRPEHPVLIDQYVMGRELEVDAVSDGEDVLIPGIMEHVERTGVHSGDSVSVYPPQNITEAVRSRIIELTHMLAAGLHVRGMINIQFIEAGGEVYIIEVNPRSSRTVPFISKITGVPVIDLAVRAALGERVRDMGYGTGIIPETKCIAVKVPIFSMDKLPGVEITLGPEMKSTGEVMGIGDTYIGALTKGFGAAGWRGGGAMLSIAPEDREEFLPIARQLADKGVALYATPGTAQSLRDAGITVREQPRMSQAAVAVEALLRSGAIGLLVQTPTKGRHPDRDGFRLRRLASECGILCLTCLDTARALALCVDAQPAQPLELGAATKG